MVVRAERKLLEWILVDDCFSAVWLDDSVSSNRPKLCRLLNVSFYVSIDHGCPEAKEVSFQLNSATMKPVQKGRRSHS